MARPSSDHLLCCISPLFVWIRFTGCECVQTILTRPYSSECKHYLAQVLNRSFKLPEVLLFTVIGHGLFTCNRFVALQRDWGFGHIYVVVSLVMHLWLVVSAFYLVSTFVHFGTCLFHTSLSHSVFLSSFLSLFFSFSFCLTVRL